MGGKGDQCSATEEEVRRRSNENVIGKVIGESVEEVKRNGVKGVRAE